MANIKTLIESTVGALFKNNADKDIVDRGNIMEYTITSLDRHQMMLSVFSALTSTSNSLSGEFLSPNNTSPWKAAYERYHRGLNRDAQNIERGNFLGSLRIAHQTFASMYGSFGRKEFEALFPDKTLSLRTMNTAQLTFLGALHCSEILCDCSVSLVGETIGTVIDQLTEATYRINNFNKYLPIFTELTNLGVKHRNGGLNLQSIILQLNKSNQNVALLTENNEPNTLFLRQNTMSPATVTFMTTGLIFVPNPFKLIGELWALYRDAQVRKLENELEWLMRKIDLLKLHLQDVDPDTREYQQLEKAITTYTTILDNYERKIQRYREGKK